jgi:hypothetical protein
MFQNDRNVILDLPVGDPFLKYSLDAGLFRGTVFYHAEQEGPVQKGKHFQYSAGSKPAGNRILRIE